MNKSKKKSKWMQGFVLGPKATDADVVRFESIQRMRDIENKQTKAKR